MALLNIKLIVPLIALVLSLPQRGFSQDIFNYRGLCDASAATALGNDHFVVADDELNTLKIYKFRQENPVGTLDLSGFLDTATEKESDLEGAAAIGTRIYWISSHGNNKSGKVRKERYRFFATEIKPGPTPALALAPIGRPYRDILNDIITAKELQAYKLADAAKLAPEMPGGLNIEGLAATPDGKLLIGFRNPIPNGASLIVPIENPADVVNGQKAKIGLPIELKLGGSGIRSIELVGTGYLIVAGPPGDVGNFALYRWSGKSDDAATLLPDIDFKDLRPEALFAIPQTDIVQILSDDGGVQEAGVFCKDKPKSKQSFRSITLKP